MEDAEAEVKAAVAKLQEAKEAKASVQERYHQRSRKMHIIGNCWMLLTFGETVAQAAFKKCLNANLECFMSLAPAA